MRFFAQFANRAASRSNTTRPPQVPQPHRVLVRPSQGLPPRRHL